MIITLTTDFGQADGYVGAMKGVMLSIAPGAQLVDISHDIPPRDIQQAAYVLYTAAAFFPPSSIHLAVVDPGVGSARRAIAARTPQAIFVAPDNGLLSLCLAGQPAEIRQLSNARYHLPHASSTFHGRDIFAPVAAHLAAGADFDDLGPRVSDALAIPRPALGRDPDGAWRGQVWHVDRFGNLITSIGRFQISDFGFRIQNTAFQAQQAVVEIAGRRIQGLVQTFADGAPNELLALVGSSGYLEIAVRDGSAAQALDAQPGDTVLLRVRHEP